MWEPRTIAADCHPSRDSPDVKDGWRLVANPRRCILAEHKVEADGHGAVGELDGGVDAAPSRGAACCRAKAPGQVSPAVPRVAGPSCPDARMPGCRVLHTCKGAGAPQQTDLYGLTNWPAAQPAAADTG